MPKLLKPKEQTPALPRQPQRRLLPAPHVSLMPSLLFIILPVIFVTIYALWPWFTISDSAVRTITWLVMILFLAGTIALFVMLWRLFFLLMRRRHEHVIRALGPLLLVLVFVLTILFFSVLILIVQPINY